MSTAPGPPGSLAEEARRLAEAFSDWTHDHSPGLGSAGESEQCRFCPLCRLIAVVRGDAPEVGERLLQTGTAFLAALRALLEPTIEDSAGPAPPRIQHIELGGPP